MENISVIREEEGLCLAAIWRLLSYLLVVDSNTQHPCVRYTVISLCWVVLPLFPFRWFVVC
jgi:hypothetical protein